MANKKLKVVHMAEGAGWGGMEAHLCSLLPGLQARDSIEVECITFHDGLLSERLRDRGIKTKVFSRLGKLDLSVFIRLITYFRSSKVDIIHLHGYLAIFYGILAAVMSGIPVRVITLHASSTHGNHNKKLTKLNFYLWLAYFLMKKSTAYAIAVSRETYDRHLTEKKISKERMRVIHNGIAIEEYQSCDSGVAKRDLGVKDTDFVVGIVGRIDENKGHIYFIRTAQSILEKRKDVHFLIVGNGPLENELKAFCRENDLEEYIHFLGFQDNILAYLSLMDILVIASSSEGIPYTLLESMGKGVPVVATNVGGIPEVIQDGVSGLLVPPRDPGAMATCVMSLLDNEPLRRRLSRKGLEILNRHFSQESMVQSTQIFYQNIRAPRSVSEQIRGRLL
jgi:glycosyltransferase involved in cell wall biosynthesis